MHYVIGDVHGCFDEMIALIDKINSMDEDATIIFVGDFIDRGPKVWETLQWAMDNITPDGKYQSVRGNHEQMLAEFIKIDYDGWYYGTLRPYIPPIKYHYDSFSLFKEKISPTGSDGVHLSSDFDWFCDFVDTLPYSKVLDIDTKWGKKVTFRIVHATHIAEETDEVVQLDNNIWGRKYDGFPDSEEIIVHGHTPTMIPAYIEADRMNNQPGMIGYRPNDINLDGGCTYIEKSPVFPDMLCAIRLEDLEEVYPYSLEERFRQVVQRSMINFYVPKNIDEYTVDLIRTYKENYLSNIPAARVDMLEKMGCPEQEMI